LTVKELKEPRCLFSSGVFFRKKFSKGLGVQKDIIEHLRDYKRIAKFYGATTGTESFQTHSSQFDGRFQQYQICTGDFSRSPELHQSYRPPGSLVFDFIMIKLGALHKANGEYHILDARTLLFQAL
jgi:hypothetical protein